MLSVSPILSDDLINSILRIKWFICLINQYIVIFVGALGLKRDTFIWARMVGEMKTGKRLSSYSKTELMAYLEVRNHHNDCN